MSTQFSDTGAYKGLVQLYELEIGANFGDVSGSTTRLKEFAARANQALDDFWAIAIPASGLWQLDDSNQTDYPVIKTNIVSGQRDYIFTTDEGGNLILDIYKVYALQTSTATQYMEIEPIDELSGYNGINSETTVGGPPCRYGKMANGIFLDPVPNYSLANALKVYINREASYFTSADTTKKPGVDGRLHKYFYLKPAAEYIRINGTPDAYTKITNEITKLEGVRGVGGLIREIYAYRAKDEPKGLSMKGINFR